MTFPEKKRLLLTQVTRAPQFWEPPEIPIIWLPPGNSNLSEPGKIWLPPGNKNQESYVTKVKVPNYNHVWIEEKIGEYNNGKHINGQRDIGICNNFHHTKQEVKKDLKKHGYKFARFEPVEIMLQDVCDNCELVGRPKFERRPNEFDYHIRSPSTEKPSKLESVRNSDVIKYKTGRDDDYVLTYRHTKGSKRKCTIGKLDKNHLNIIKKGKVHQGLKKRMFPFYIKAFQKFL